MRDKWITFTTRPDFSKRVSSTVTALQVNICKSEGCGFTSQGQQIFKPHKHKPQNSVFSEKYKVQLTFETGWYQLTNENKLKDTKSNFLMCVLMI